MSERLPLNSLQKGIYSRLTDGDVGIDTDVFDEVVDAVMPYVEIGSCSVSLELEKISEATTTLHAYSDAAGNKACNDILEASIESLTGSALTLDESFTQALGRLELAEIFKEYHADGKVIRHGVLRFRWILSDDA
jgi:hypothetical protein